MVASYLANLTSLSGTEFVISGINGDGTKIIGQDFTMSNYQNPAVGVNHIKYQPEQKETIVSISYDCVKFRNAKKIMVTINGIAKSLPLDQIYSNFNNKRINFKITGDIFSIGKLLGQSFDFTISLS